MNLSSQEPTKVQISTLSKNKKCILVIALNPKILYMCLLIGQLNKTLNKRNHRNKGYAKMHKILGNLTFQN